MDIGGVKAIELKVDSLLETAINITGLYRSPQVDTQLFIQNLRQYLERHAHDSNHIIVGDININILQPDRYGEEYMTMLYEFGFISTINEHTRVQGQSKSCIDHIFIKTNIHIGRICPAVLSDDMTDHYPVILKIKHKGKVEQQLSQEQLYKIKKSQLRKAQEINIKRNLERNIH